MTVKVENMKEQHKNAKAAAKPKKETFEPAEPVEDFGFVAVAAGEGLKNLFKDLGCANVVSGGQSMNPSTDDIYAAVMATPAKMYWCSRIIKISFLLPSRLYLWLRTEMLLLFLQEQFRRV